MADSVMHESIGPLSRLATFRDAVMCDTGCGGVLRWLRAPLRVVLWAALRTGLAIRVEGHGRPGPAIVVSNHPNVLDGLVVLLADPSMRPIARWHRRMILRLGMWIADCVTTTTGTPVSPHRGAFAGALDHMRRGGRVWVAPEGGCQPDLALQHPRSGAVRLAHATGAPIQVLAVRHGHHPGPSWSTWRVWRRPRILLRWGPVVPVTGDLQVDIDRMMRAIAETAGATWTPASTGGTVVTATAG